MNLAWSGSDRVGLFRVVAGLAIATAIDLAASLHTTPVVPPHPDAPAWLLTVASSWAVTVALSLCVVVAALASARRAAAIGWTVVWIAALALLAESAAAVGPGPYRGWTFVGAVGTGIVVGRGWTRLAVRGTGSARLEARGAEIGAVASLVACYVGAATSKLGGAGLGWADAATLQAVVLAHAHVDRPGIASALLDTPQLATALAWMTLLVQLGAVGLLLGPRARVLATIGLVAFHVGVAVLARIGYWSAVVLVLAVGLPWSRWLARDREVAEDPELPSLDRRADLVVGGVLAIAIAFAWLGPWRSYSDGHHRSRTLAAGFGEAREPVTRFGPVAVGDTFDAWTIVGLERERGRVMVVLDHAEHPRAVLWVTRRDASQGGNSPFDRGALRIAYEPPLPPQVTNAAKQVAEMLASDPMVLERLDEAGGL